MAVSIAKALVPLLAGLLLALAPGPEGAATVLYAQEGEESEARNLADWTGETPGGSWMAQLLISCLAAAMTLVTLRADPKGLPAAAVILPVSAYTMAAVGVGNFWLPTVQVLLLGMPFLAWRFLTRGNQ